MRTYDDNNRCTICCAHFAEPHNSECPNNPDRDEGGE